MRDLSGKWSFKEEFDYGHTKGSVTFIQNGDKLFGTAILTEFQDGDSPFEVKQEIEGIVMENNVVFKGIQFELVSPEIDCDYYLDSWEGKINSAGDIIGSSIDQSGACGVFIMKRTHE